MDELTFFPVSLECPPSESSKTSSKTTTSKSDSGLKGSILVLIFGIIGATSKASKVSKSKVKNQWIAAVDMRLTFLEGGLGSSADEVYAA